MDLGISNLANNNASTYYLGSATASGTDTYTATLTTPPSAYVLGQVVDILFTNANTGAATINLNSLGAKSIVKGLI